MMNQRDAIQQDASHESALLYQNIYVYCPSGFMWICQLCLCSWKENCGK
jgi:hypothetical protein